MHQSISSAHRFRAAGLVCGIVLALAAAGALSADADNAACLACHGTAGFSAPRADGQSRALHVTAASFDASVHGKSLRCVDCHAMLADVPHTKVSRTRLEWRQRVPEMCATCHADAVKDYLASAHGDALATWGNVSAAICTDCHRGHGVARVQPAQARLALLQACVSCHREDWRSYVQTHHGKRAALGTAETATCADCHGGHAIRHSSAAVSSASSANRLKTCRKCHAEATAGFASFQPHAVTHDFGRYPAMWLSAKFLLLIIVTTFGVFWTHSALWFYREYRDRKERKLRPHVHSEQLAPEKELHRWSLAWRIAHFVFALSVIVLVVTGLPLLYPERAWAAPLAGMLGGPDTASMVHKISAVIMMAIFVAHLGYVAVYLVRHWKTFKVFGPYSVMPNLQDVYDIIAMLKWFLGKAPRPLFDHWNYTQKFDYWAPFWGITMLTATGVMLWFTELTAAVLPGWAFNVATLVHGEEAWLAAVYLFTIHYFANHVRPDKFPLDRSIFTGAIPLDEFKREYAVEYRRLLESGRLQEFLVDAPSRPMTRSAQIVGVAMIVIGLVLLAMLVHGYVADILKA